MKLPILRTPMITMNWINLATLAIDNEFAPQGTEHATTLDIKGVGVMLRMSLVARFIPRPSCVSSCGRGCITSVPENLEVQMPNTKRMGDLERSRIDPELMQTVGTSEDTTSRGRPSSL